MPTPPTLLLDPPLTVLVERLVEGVDAELRLPPEEADPPLRAVLLERLVDALEREDELLIVPPTALEVDPLLRLTLAEELLREEPELRDELVWLEDERLLPPPRDWALTGDIASAIAATAASASLNVVFIMLNFSVRKYSLSILI